MGRIDNFLNKWVSKKLLVVILGFMAMLYGKLGGVEWVALASAYTISQAFVDGKKQ